MMSFSLSLSFNLSGSETGIYRIFGDNKLDDMSVVG